MIRTMLMTAAIAAAATMAAGPAHADKKLQKLRVTIEESMKEVEAQDHLDNFQIQQSSPTAANVRSQAEKRLEQQRKDLTRNWGG